MRLASRIFLAFATLVVAMAAIATYSLWAVGRLVAVNHGITTQAVPAVRLVAAVRHGANALGRLEARHVVLGDAVYATLWDEASARVQDELDRLGAVVTTAEQRRSLGEVTTAFAGYAAVVQRERELLARGARTEALRLVEGDARARREHAEARLDRLAEATDAAVTSALAEAAALERRTWTGVLLALGTSLALALAGTALIAQRTTRSLRRLSAATRAVADGSFRAPIEVGTRDEVGELAQSFNAMAQKLHQIDQTKEEFFAAISHDLRSPLASVAEAAYLLRDEVAGPLTPRQRRLVAIIESSSARVLALVSRILDLSRLRAGVLPVERQPVSLDRVVMRVVEELRPQAEAGEVRLEHEVARGDFVVEGDETRLAEIVANLGSNAIRFTPRGGTVHVRLSEAGPEVGLEVEDTGIGIPPDALPSIFERYQQVRRDRDGIGLGLAIVKGVVEAHGGRVSVESAEGKGTRFTVMLPRPRAAR